MKNNIVQYGDGNNNGSGGNNSNNNRGNGGSGSEGRRPRIFLFLTILLIIGMAFLVYNMFFSKSTKYTGKEYTAFIDDLEAGKVESVQLNAEDAELKVTLKVEAVTAETDDSGAQGNTLAQYAYYSQVQNNRVYVTNVMESMDTLTARLEEYNVVGSRKISANSGLFTEILIGVVLPLALMWLIASFFIRRMGAGGSMGVGKSNAKVYVQKETGVTFADVAGEDEAKESLVEVVDFLHDPKKYTEIGARLPKGALLVGPPGTGKTLLARAVAGEAHVPFFSLTGSDFIELYVGVGASRVRDLFKEANKNAPCIIFIDEIDAIGRSRDSKYGGGNEEREQTLNQLLSEMDGFDGSKGILILGATNRPEILDKALLRPGRFDRRVIVDKPDLKGRVEILKVHAKNVKMDETVDLDAIALATSGAVGSELANMINEAAINAVKEKRKYVNQQDLFNAVEQVLVGKEKKDRIMNAEERKIVSYHEVGHALISALQKNSDPVQKITIVPRTMGALGYVMNVPEEEKYLNSEAELRDRIVSLLGGRAAEEIMFDSVTTGASNDLEKATELVRNMITRFGMSKRFGLMSLATVESQYLEGRSSLNCSDQTAALVDQEIAEIIKESYEKALTMLRENVDVMDKLAAFLIEKETITGKEFMEIFRREKGLPNPDEEKNDDEKSEGVKTEDKTDDKSESEKSADDMVVPIDDAIPTIVVGDTETESKVTSGKSAFYDEEVKAEDVTDVGEAKADDKKDDDKDGNKKDDDNNRWTPPGSPNDGRDVGRFSNSRMD
ncbi:MAG: ATP-dependent zinc metalloprotease FtsH [Lachnospiraceae bacterium]|nr:ATP-dependent zinc metalloprotease FtsH [Lachnospiraceae bacterium]